MDKDSFKNTSIAPIHTLNCKGRLLTMEKPLVMGILNATPDSFFEASRVNRTTILQKAEKMLEEGASILDIGGQSTRPGSERISPEEEKKRILPLIEELNQHFPEAVVSVDTYHASLALECVHAGASIINDISGGMLDPTMLEIVARCRVPYICMHIQGSPEHMQQSPTYKDITLDVLDHFIERIHACSRQGITDIILDPGFGFGKTHQHNFQLLHNLSAFQVLGKPILAGLSRKSTIYKTLGTTPEEALNGSTVLHTIASLHGANILRVHDVKEAMECIRLVDAYRNAINEDSAAEAS